MAGNKLRANGPGKAGIYRENMDRDVLRLELDFEVEGRVMAGERERVNSARLAPRKPLVESPEEFA